MVDIDVTSSNHANSFATGGSKGCYESRCLGAQRSIFMMGLWWYVSVIGSIGGYLRKEKLEFLLFRHRPRRCRTVEESLMK